MWGGVQMSDSLYVSNVVCGFFDVNEVTGEGVQYADDLKRNFVTQICMIDCVFSVELGYSIPLVLYEIIDRSDD